jgi:hypothetical protein
MTEIVLNGCYGGFSLSREAVKYMADKGCKISKELLNEDIDSYYLFQTDKERYNPLLVEAVKNLGEKANGRNAQLYIDKIEGTKFRISEYDGLESIETPDRIHWTEIEN